MKIYSMTATFGKLEHTTLTLQPGLNVIHAPNEWGKSTWCAFLVAMLYGIDSRVHGTTKTALADKARYDPWSGQLMSGRMELNWQGRDITIERSSTKRSQFREFKAFDTHTGLPIAELTGENCGQQLLGVEKEVFQRAGFIRLTDLPVTQSDALRRRLNALVTTGDESGAADRLATQLNKLKNECRANRSKGLLPQAEAQRTELEQKLDRLTALQTEAENLRQRQCQLEEHRRQLINHKAALDYAASQSHSTKLAQAEQNHAAATRQVEALEGVCKALPEPEIIERNLQQLRLLRENRDSIQMEAQMQPPVPPAPTIPEAFQGLSEADALRQAKTDCVVCQQALKEEKGLWGILLGALLAVSGIACLLIPYWVGKAAGIAALLAGILLVIIQLVGRRRAAATADALAQKYNRQPPESWVSTTQALMRRQTEHQQLLAQMTADREDLHRRMLQNKQTLDELTQGLSVPTYEQQLLSAQASYQGLGEARRELQRCQTLLQALQEAVPAVSAPTMPDELTYSPADTARLLSDCEIQLRQLHHQQGQTQGQMAALGQETALRSQLQAVQQRIAKLEDTLTALELAQATLSQATAQLQSRFAPRITQRASALFSRLTGGRYQRLSLTQDLNLQTCTESEDTLRSILWRSDGTADQLYLALRLAVAEELTPEAPLVLDDALVRFDDDRLKAALEVIKEEAASRQVILFTCHSREEELLQ